MKKNKQEKVSAAVLAPREAIIKIQDEMNALAEQALTDKEVRKQFLELKSKRNELKLSL